MFSNRATFVTAPRLWNAMSSELRAFLFLHHQWKLPTHINHIVFLRLSCQSPRTRCRRWKRTCSFFTLVNSCSVFSLSHASVIVLLLQRVARVAVTVMTRTINMAVAVVLMMMLLLMITMALTTMILLLSIRRYLNPVFRGPICLDSEVLWQI